MNNRIFLSYSHEDSRLAKSVIASLMKMRPQPVSVDDPSLLADVAQDPRKVIAKALGQADSVVLVWSNQAAKSSWVHYEIGMAEALGLPIRVLVAEGTDAKLPGNLSNSDVKLERFGHDGPSLAELEEKLA